MRCRLCLFLLCVAAVFAAAAPASAQFYNPPPQVAAPYSPQPALSPFLNLLRGGDPAANYYLGVLPEYNNRYFQQIVRKDVLQPQLRYNEQYLDDGSEIEVQIRQLPPTGHTAGFMIYNAFYNMPNARGFIPYNPAVRTPTPQIPR